MKLGFEVSVSSVKGLPYDLLIRVRKYSQRDEWRWIRGQVKTVRKSVSFIGGSRGGKDRFYRSGVKTYKYTTTHNDLIIAIDKNTMDLYLIPTMFLDLWGKSKSIGKLLILKNNWDILLNWNPRYLKRIKAQLT